ncbi:MAG: YqeG family HAD IIIA-type phosphatase [Synechococcales cyanobacterium]
MSWQVWQWWQPTIRLSGRIDALQAPLLTPYGIQGLILDVDDTIVDRWSRAIPTEILSWFATMQPQFQMWLVSNNTSRQRIHAIAEQVQLPYIHGAGKPSRRALRQAVTAMKLQPTQVAMVGDRLLTDILAGNRLGLITVWVEPIRAKPLLLRI